MLCIRGVVLPEREERTFWIDGEVLRAGGPPGGLAGRDAETIVDGGWLLAAGCWLLAAARTRRRTHASRGAGAGRP
ncbi:hypothetical protein ACFTXM_08145 [Streptomyces sp. NPDC056930]|uniref:hypothetical protein n=1 Tax=Streptomyces sp. NPDC056930 TaxID=3345967 RepID=UPI003642FAB3